jgi:phosphatidylserine decarboxylase
LVDKSFFAFLAPINRHGYPFIGIFAAATLLLSFIGSWAFWIGVALTLWCVYFFRDPARTTPARPGLVIAPADGVVMLIETAPPPAELGLAPTPLPRVSIFMNVFDVHVNRAPADGLVRRIAYRPGKFFNASLDKASEQNERNSFLLELEEGRQLVVVQIAGLVARRIVPFVAEGERVQAGGRIGMIRFGSRVDVYLPEGTSPLVIEGQRAVAGETVLADLASDEPSRQGRSV